MYFLFLLKTTKKRQCKNWKVSHHWPLHINEHSWKQETCQIGVIILRRKHLLDEKLHEQRMCKSRAVKHTLAKRNTSMQSSMHPCNLYLNWWLHKYKVQSNVHYLRCFQCIYDLQWRCIIRLSNSFSSPSFLFNSSIITSNSNIWRLILFLLVSNSSITKHAWRQWKDQAWPDSSQETIK